MRRSTFRPGAFPLDKDNYYYAVTDLIFLAQPRAMSHEIAHRIFSVANGGFYALRTLAGISHNLFQTLFQMGDHQRGHLGGRILNTLEAVNVEPKVVADVLIERIRYVENLVDMCYWSLFPIADIW